MADKLTVNALQVLQNEIRKQMNEMSDHISGGGCNDFGDYQPCTGIIKGLAVAERELLDLNQRIDDA